MKLFSLLLLVFFQDLKTKKKISSRLEKEKLYYLDLVLQFTSSVAFSLGSPVFG